MKMKTPLWEKIIGTRTTGLPGFSNAVRTAAEQRLESENKNQFKKTRMKTSRTETWVGRLTICVKSFNIEK